MKPDLKAIAEAMPILAQASINISEDRHNTFRAGSFINAAINVVVAHADFIVQAVNSHDELVIALERTSRVLAGSPFQSDMREIDIRQAIEKASTAIHNAKETKP